MLQNLVIKTFGNKSSSATNPKKGICANALLQVFKLLKPQN